MHLHNCFAVSALIHCTLMYFHVMTGLVGQWSRSGTDAHWIRIQCLKVLPGKFLHRVGSLCSSYLIPISYVNKNHWSEVGMKVKYTSKMSWSDNLQVDILRYIFSPPPKKWQLRKYRIIAVIFVGC